ncbi:unnamed protein product [Ixodes pacificus]
MNLIIRGPFQIPPADIVSNIMLRCFHEFSWPPFLTCVPLLLAGNMVSNQLLLYSKNTVSLACRLKLFQVEAGTELYHSGVVVVSQPRYEYIGAVCIFNLILHQNCWLLAPTVAFIMITCTHIYSPPEESPAFWCPL